MLYLIFAFYFLLRFVPYLISSIPRGYDPGLYLYLWHHNLSIDWLRTIYPPVIFYLGKFLNLFTSPENYLIPLSFIVAISLFVAIYLYTKNKWTVFLLACSAIQYRMWWWYYIKNILAISFIFFYLYFSKKKSSYSLLVTSFLVFCIPLLHQPTAIIFFLILVFQKDLVSCILFLVSFLFYYSSTYLQTISPYLSSVVSTVGASSGTFYNLPQSLLLMLPYLPFTLYGFYFSLKNKQNRVTCYVSLITLFIPLFGLFLSHRFIPFFDIFAIILAGYALQFLNSKFKIFKFVYPSLLIILILIFVFKTSAPLIAEDELAEIKLLNTTPVNSYILVTDNEYTPWVYGYSERKPITPGFGEYDIYWTNDEWNQFWADHNQIELLKKLPQPLYIWSGDKSARRFNPAGDCYTRFSWHVWQFGCVKK